MSAKRWHDLILGTVLVLAVIELLVLPILKVITGHAVWPWLQK